MNSAAGDLKAVIWDMDGVIVDTAQEHFVSWQQAFRKRGVVFSDTDFKRHFGQRNDTIIMGILGEGVTRADINAIAEDKEVFFRQNIVKDMRPFPGVIRLLKTLQENGIPSSIASSAPLENVCLILSHLKIDSYFQAIVYGNEVSEGKPSPQVFLMAAKKLGARPENCIVVEDAIAGVMAAKSAGMLCLAVTNTHSAAHLSQADLIVDSLDKVTLDDLNRLFENSKP
jgi:beta-phosphoglucomutase family hydrolase